MNNQILTQIGLILPIAVIVVSLRQLSDISNAFTGKEQVGWF